MEYQSTEPTAPRAGTKQAKLVAMLFRKSGVMVAKASKALEWQRHTTRAALTGLKKRGYKVKHRDRKGSDSVYIIAGDDQ